jgi:hypothetical protein
VTRGLRALGPLATLLRRRRADAGSLDLSVAEWRLQLHEDTGLTLGMSPGERYSSQDLVEEFMILANLHVGRALAARLPNSAVLRSHGNPAEAYLQPLQDALPQRGLPTLDMTDGKTLTSSLKRIEALRQPHLDTVLRLAVTRSLPTAKYVLAGSGPVSHFGLALDYYTHFTSPIRRYADVIVHRQLQRILATPEAPEAQEGDATGDRTALQGLVEHLNLKTAQAQHVTRLSFHLHAGDLFANRQQTTTAYIIATGLLSSSAYSPELGLEGRVPAKFHGKTLQLLDEVQVTITVAGTESKPLLRWSITEVRSSDGKGAPPKTATPNAAKVRSAGPQATGDGDGVRPQVSMTTAFVLHVLQDAVRVHVPKLAVDALVPTKDQAGVPTRSRLKVLDTVTVAYTHSESNGYSFTLGDPRKPPPADSPAARDQDPKKRAWDRFPDSAASPVSPPSSVSPRPTPAKPVPVSEAFVDYSDYFCDDWQTDPSLPAPIIFTVPASVSPHTGITVCDPSVVPSPDKTAPPRRPRK